MPASVAQLDDRARQVMRDATRNAHALGHAQIESEHILLGILDEGSGVTDSFLRAIDRDFRLVRAELENRMPAQMELNTIGRLPKSRTATQILEHAGYEAIQSGSGFTSPSHLVLGILLVPETVANAALEQIGVRIDDIREDVKNEPNKENAV